MQSIPLTASVRDGSVHARHVRKARKVPCVVYGNVPNTMLECEENALHKVYAQAGESTLVELTFGGSTIPTLIHAVQFDPLSGRLAHVDFYAVDMNREIEANVPVHFEGVAPAVKNLGAIFVTAHDHVTVRCLPANLPHALTVSVAGLENFHDVVTVAALQVPEGVAVKESPETVLALVQEPRAEEVQPVAAAPTEGEAAVEGAEGASAPISGDDAKEEHAQNAKNA